MSNNNAVEVHKDNKVAPMGGPVTDVSSFANLLDTSKFEHMYRVAKVFAGSQLVPAHFQDSISDCFVAVQMAVRLDVDPFMFMQNTYILHGRPGMEAKLAIALVNKSGVFAGPIQYEIEGNDPKDDAYRVRACGTVRDTGEVVHGPWIDWQMVKAEGWLGKKGSKWQTMPAMMFQYRAATFFARLYAPEALMGMHTHDELVDMGPSVATKPTSRPVDALNAALLPKAAEPEPEHAPEPEPAAEAEEKPQSRPSQTVTPEEAAEYGIPQTLL